MSYIADGAKRKGALHRFFLVNPKADANGEELAEKIAALPAVEEVFINDRNDGYVVKARFFLDREPKNAASFISHSVGRKFGNVREDNK